MESEESVKVPGLIEGVECLLVKTDPSLIEKISKRTRIEISLVKRMMRHNVFTVQQFSDLADMPIHTAYALMKPGFKGDKVTEPKLNFCFPFPDTGGSGPKYIVRNEKSEAYLRK